MLSLVLGAAPSALADTALVDARPGPGRTVERLAQIRLSFAGPIAAGEPVTISLTGPRGKRWDAGPARLIDARTIAVDVADRLPVRGDYTVRWCATAAGDGHAQAGRYSFTYAGPTTAGLPAPPSRPSGNCSVAGGGRTATVAGWLTIATVAGLVLYLVAAAARRKQRRPAA